MQLSGLLEDRALEHVLREISSQHWSGKLRLDFGSDDGQRQEAFLLFSRGRLLTCFQTDEPDDLPNELVRRNLVSASQMQTVLAACRDEDRRLEECLVNEDFVSQGELETIYKDILFQRLKFCLDNPRGRYEFQRAEEEGTNLLLPDLALDFDALYLAEGLTAAEFLQMDPNVLTLSEPEVELDVSENLSGEGVEEPSPIEIDVSVEIEPEVSGRLTDSPNVDDLEFIDLSEALGFDGENLQGLALDDLGFLNSMLNELNNPEGKSNITFLLLRYASQVFPRGVLFRVEGENLRSMGEFGFDQESEEQAEKIRTLLLPLAETEVFQEALRNRQVLKQSPIFIVGKKAFLDLLGEPLPKEVFVAPIFSRDQPMALVYGDFGPNSTLQNRTSGLEIFLSQIGLTLEKQFLQERIEELEQTKD